MNHYVKVALWGRGGLKNARPVLTILAFKQRPPAGFTSDGLIDLMQAPNNRLIWKTFVLWGLSSWRAAFMWNKSLEDNIYLASLWKKKCNNNKKNKTKRQLCPPYTRLNNVIVHIHVITNHYCLCWHECVRLEEALTSYSQGHKLWFIWFHIMQWRIFITASLFMETQT